MEWQPLDNQIENTINHINMKTQNFSLNNLKSIVSLRYPYRKIAVAILCLMTMSIGQVWGSTWMEEPSITINGTSKKASNLTSDKWETQTSMKITTVTWYAKRNDKSSDGMWAEGMFRYGVSGTTNTSWTDITIDGGTWYDDYKTNHINKDINLELCSNRKPGDYELYFCFAHRTGDNSYVYYSNNGSNYHIFWTIPDPTIELTADKTPHKGEEVTLSVNTSNWPTGMTITQVEWINNGSSAGSVTSGTLSSQSKTLTPSASGSGKVGVKVTCKFGTAGDVTYERYLDVYETYSIYVEDTRDWGKMYLLQKTADGSQSYKNLTFPGEVQPIAFTIGNKTYYEVTLETYYQRFWLSDGTNSKQTFNDGICNNYDYNSTQKITPSDAGTIWQVVKDNNKGENDCYLKKMTITPYRLKSTGGAGTYYSNTLTGSGTFSLWCKKGGTLILEKLVNGSWTTQSSGVTITATGVTEDNVYTCSFNGSNTVNNFAPYTGKYYIHTNKAAGQESAWKPYENLTNEQREAAEFTYFEPNANYSNELYNYYWVAWMPDGTNVSASVGNEYNMFLSTPIYAETPYTQADGTVQAGGEDKGANVRYGYSPITNKFLRSFIGGSIHDNKFLTAYAAEGLYEDNNGTIGNQITKNVYVKFDDISNWVYQLDVFGVKNGDSRPQVIVRSNFGKETALFGGGTTQEILGINTADGTYKMRMLYDFKTNRIMAAWYPEGANFDNSGETKIEANFMMSRTDNEEAKTLNMTQDNATIVKLRQLISVLEITKIEYDKSSAHYYWVSLPYDCYIKDIFGIPGYGTKWVVQRYRGDMRGQYGFRHDITTFWANMKQTATAKMEANRGYVIRFNLSTSDFKTIGERSSLNLFFPSASGQTFTLTNSGENLTTNAPEHLCEAYDEVKKESRTKYDSHWNVIGNPGMRTMKITAPTTVSDGGQYENQPNFYYEWKYVGTDLKQNYTVRSIAEDAYNKFRPMYAYMVQYAGDITWEASVKTTATPVSSIPARRTMADKEDVLIRLMLQQSAEDSTEMLDQTYIQLSERGSEEFLLSRDLAKNPTGGAMIYTVCDSTRTAGKLLPHDTYEIPLGISSDQSATLTIALGEDVDKTVILVDRIEEKEVILGNSVYTFDMDSAAVDDRFLIRLQNRTDVQTAIDDTDADIRIHSTDGGLYLEGTTDKVQVTLYDAVGKMLYSGRVSAGELIPTPAHGAFLIRIGDSLRKIIR